MMNNFKFEGKLHSFLS